MSRGVVGPAALRVGAPVGEVVVGVGHVDQALDEVGVLDQAQKHLEEGHNGWSWFWSSWSCWS